jgi:hypothetical protein
MGFSFGLMGMIFIYITGRRISQGGFWGGFRLQGDFPVVRDDDTVGWPLSRPFLLG